MVYNNSEIAKRFGISNNTVERWINNALEHKNNLQLELIKQKTNDRLVFKIEVSVHNDGELMRLFELGQKNSPSKYSKDIVLGDEVAKIFTTRQLANLVNDLDDKCIPLKYSYVDGGGKMWNDYVTEGEKSGKYMVSQQTIDLLDNFLNYLNYINVENKKINFIDIGCGNFAPVVPLIKYLKKINLLNKYIAVDISDEMLKIAEIEALKILDKNDIITVQRDFDNENVSDYTNVYRNENVFNIIACLGGTIGNYSEPKTILTHLKDSLIRDDLLLLSNSVDVESKVKFPTLGKDRNKERRLWIPELFGIDINEVEIVSTYSSDKDMKLIKIKLDKDYNITVPLAPDIHRQLNFKKGDEITVWHHKMTRMEAIPAELSSVGLELLNFIKTREGNLGLFVARKNLKILTK